MTRVSATHFMKSLPAGSLITSIRSITSGVSSLRKPIAIEWELFSTKETLDSWMLIGLRVFWRYRFKSVTRKIGYRNHIRPFRYVEMAVVDAHLTTLLDRPSVSSFGVIGQLDLALVNARRLLAERGSLTTSNFRIADNPGTTPLTDSTAFSRY